MKKITDKSQVMLLPQVSLPAKASEVWSTQSSKSQAFPVKSMAPPLDVPLACVRSLVGVLWHV